MAEFINRGFGRKRESSRSERIPPGQYETPDFPVLTAGPTRMDAMIKSKLPYVGSCGALDMVNFWAMETVPAKFNGRNFIKHNSNVNGNNTRPYSC